MRDAVTRLHDSEQWHTALARYGWTDAYLTGAEFGTFLREENDRLGALLGSLGLANVPSATPNRD